MKKLTKQRNKKFNVYLAQDELEYLRKRSEQTKYSISALIRLMVRENMEVNHELSTH